MRLKTSHIPRTSKIILLLFLLFLPDMELFAQCAVCRASAESSLEAGKTTVGRGLNNGILYLMTIPYLILMGILFYFFKKQVLQRLKTVKDKFLS